MMSAAAAGGGDPIGISSQQQLAAGQQQHEKEEKQLVDLQLFLSHIMGARWIQLRKEAVERQEELGAAGFGFGFGSNASWDGSGGRWHTSAMSFSDLVCRREQTEDGGRGQRMREWDAAWRKEVDSMDPYKPIHYPTKTPVVGPGRDLVPETTAAPSSTETADARRYHSARSNERVPHHTHT